MKKILFSILTAFSVLFGFSSCGTGEVVVAAGSDAAIYYDYDNTYLVIYRDGVPFYQIYDYVLRNYYFRPVPRERYRFITPRPHVRREVRPMQPMQPYRQNNRGNYRRPRNQQPDRIAPQPRPDNRGNHPVQPRENFNGRR